MRRSDPFPRRCAIGGLLVSVGLVTLACASPQRVRQTPGETLPRLPPTVSVRRATTTTAVVIPTYVVQRGDTLQAIADALGVKVADLAAANNIVDQNRIEEGQVLTVPTTTTPA